MVKKAQKKADKSSKGSRGLPKVSGPPQSGTDDLAFYKFVIQSLPVAVVTVNGQLRVTGFNPMAEQITGYTQQEAIGRFCGEVLQGGQCGLNCPLRQVLENVGPMVQLETTIQKKEGSRATVRLHVAGLFDEGGKLIGGVEAFIDISHLKALERERANIISMIAHDMKSPLISIQGFTLRLIRKMDELDRKKRMEYLDIIRRESEKLEVMINDFLDFSRLREGKYPLSLSPTSLDKILLELSEVYEYLASQKGIKLELVDSEPLPLIEADSNAIRRVFANLLDNAVKFSQEGGTIRIETGTLDGHVFVRVQDEGKGIHPDDLPFIFDAYHRGRGSKHSVGYGVGLAAVKAIVEGHGGRVTVESQPGKGAAFTVVLPVGVEEGR